MNDLHVIRRNKQMIEMNTICIGEIGSDAWKMHLNNASKSTEWSNKTVPMWLMGTRFNAISYFESAPREPNRTCTEPPCILSIQSQPLAQSR
jgi:hypothetical protein